MSLPLSWVTMRIKSWLKGSAYTGRLPMGCRHCARGGKLVLLITGECGEGCYYCPLSREKKGKRIIYANELRVSEDADILSEARLIAATGTGITGGDPLLRAEETAQAIHLLKDGFGDKHHVHLYTSSTEKRAISIVAKSGLDEIRFHPPNLEWERLRGGRFDRAIVLSKSIGLSVGIEIPAIPGVEKGVSELLRFAHDKELDFVNLNELEFSETNYKKLGDRGFEVKNDISGAVKGSEELAMMSIEKSCDGLSVHYCSSSFKDGVQLRRRIMRRARRIKRNLDILTEDGTLLMGIVESERPGKLLEKMRRDFGIPANLIEANHDLRRVEIAPWVLEDISKELENDSFIIEEYPTADRLEVEREKLSSRRR